MRESDIVNVYRFALGTFCIWVAAAFIVSGYAAQWLAWAGFALVLFEVCRGVR